VQDGKIAGVGDARSIRVPADSQILDCSGLTITAGFWNSHVHFFERKWANVPAIPATELSRQLEEMLTRYGFTSVFDLGSTWTNTRSLRQRIESGEVAGPRIRSTGEVLVAAGAVPPDAVISALGYIPIRNHEIGDPAQATPASKSLIAAGTDGIKVHMQRPPPPHPALPGSAIEAAVKEAHSAGKPVFAHPNSAADVLTAVEAGVDIIAHTTPSSGPWDQTLLAKMKERRVAVIPTLTVWSDLLRHDRISTQQQAVSAAIEQLRAWLASGGSVLFGIDLGAAAYDPTQEYMLMAEAGMKFRQILASLTTAPAERFGASANLGRVVAGFAADLTVLRSDPVKDIRALADVRYTLRDGKIIYRSLR
jgi:imidazolonepropionase-like amidohydrolase